MHTKYISKVQYVDIFKVKFEQQLGRYDLCVLCCRDICWS